MLDTQNQGPQCRACGSPMRLTAIEPSSLGQDLRTFACPQCKRVQLHIIESAVTEAWIAPEIRPPQTARLCGAVRIDPSCPKLNYGGPILCKDTW
jgi:hypothetical protein